MKNFSKILVGLLLPIFFAACTGIQNTSEPVSIETHMDTISYVIGLWMGNGPLNVPDKDQINVNIVKKGIVDAISGEELAFTQADIQKVLQQFSMEQQAKQTQLSEVEGEVNIKEGEEYLTANKAKEGVEVTESGLQYKVIKEGAGPHPAATDKVRVHYTGKLINGEVFDSSHDRGEPTEFVLNQVIPGWTEGLQLMNKGAVYELVIPSELGYGARGAGQKIKPNSVLVFEVELIDILDQ